MSSKVNALLRTYDGILDIGPFLVKKNGKIKVPEDVSDPESGMVPWMIEGKSVSLPTKAALKHSEDYTIFHPLKESIMLGPPKTVTAYRDLTVRHINEYIMHSFIESIFNLQSQIDSLDMSDQALVSGYPKLTRADVKHMHNMLDQIPCFAVDILTSKRGNISCKVVTTMPLLAEVFSILEESSNKPVVGNYKSTKTSLKKFSEIMLKLLGIREGDTSITMEDNNELAYALEVKQLPSIILVYLSFANILGGDISSVARASGGEGVDIDGCLKEAKCLKSLLSAGPLKELVQSATSNCTVSKKKKKTKKKKKAKKRKSKGRRRRSERREYAPDPRDTPPWDVPNLTDEEIALVNLGLITPMNMRGGKKPKLNSGGQPQQPMTGYPQQPMYPQNGYVQQPPQPMYPQNGYPQQPQQPMYPQNGYVQQPMYPQQPQQPQQPITGYPPVGNPNNWGNNYR